MGWNNPVVYKILKKYALGQNIKLVQKGCCSRTLPAFWFERAWLITIWIKAGSHLSPLSPLIRVSLNQPQALLYPRETKTALQRAMWPPRHILKLFIHRFVQPEHNITVVSHYGVIHSTCSVEIVFLGGNYNDAGCSSGDKGGNDYWILSWKDMI